VIKVLLENCFLFLFYFLRWLLDWEPCNLLQHERV
jgi:hypothetical protein